jgi:hypothetical protein
MKLIYLKLISLINHLKQMKLFYFNLFDEFIIFNFNELMNKIIYLYLNS